MGEMSLIIHQEKIVLLKRIPYCMYRVSTKWTLFANTLYISHCSVQSCFSFRDIVIWDCNENRYTYSNLQSQMIFLQGTFDECYSILYIHVLVTKIKLFQLGLIIFMIQMQIFRPYSQKDLHYGIFVNVKQ